jgi:hypothetical protein
MRKRHQHFEHQNSRESMRVLQIPIIKADFDDEVCWIQTPNAQCTTKSAYTCFLQDARSKLQGIIFWQREENLVGCVEK